jgi:hypothetical protein
MHSSADKGERSVARSVRFYLPGNSLPPAETPVWYFHSMTFSVILFFLPCSPNCPVPVAVDNVIARRTSRFVPQCHSPILLQSPRDAAPKGPLSRSSREPISPTPSTQLLVLPGFRPTSCRGEGGGGDLMGGRAVVDKRIALISKAANLTRSSTVRKSLSSFTKS